MNHVSQVGDARHLGSWYAPWPRDGRRLRSRQPFCAVSLKMERTSLPGEAELPPDQPRMAEPAADADALAALAQEVARLRRALLKQGHAQELFHQRIEEEVRDLARQRSPPAPAPAPDPEQPQAAASPAGDTAATTATVAGAAGGLPNPAQLRAMLDLDRAVLHMLHLARGQGGAAAPGDPDSSPHSVAEGLGLLQIRVRNLQLSMGLEPIPTVGHPFDDRLHQVHGISHRADLPDGQVTEEILPGFRLRGRLLRPALITVNQHLAPESTG